MIDWDRVKSLRSEIGAEDFEEVVDLFLEEVDEVIGRLKTAPDPTRYEADLHFLKGSALNLGFHDFSDLCQIGERAAADGRAGAIDIGRVIALYGESRRAFLAGLVRLQAGSDAA